MKRTTKYLAALAAAQRAGIHTSFPVQETLYEALILKGYAWNASAGEWAFTKRPIRADGVESVSIFTNEDGLPSGTYRLRVMSHPDEMETIVSLLRSKLNVIEVSEKEYPNRRGEGVRMYLTCKVRKS